MKNNQYNHTDKDKVEGFVDNSSLINEFFDGLDIRINHLALLKEQVCIVNVLVYIFIWIRVIM